MPIKTKLPNLISQIGRNPKIGQYPPLAGLWGNRHSHRLPGGNTK